MFARPQTRLERDLLLGRRVDRLLVRKQCCMGWGQISFQMEGKQPLAARREREAPEHHLAGTPSSTPPVISSQIMNPCWCPTELVLKGEHKEFPLPPAPNKDFNFTNGIGMIYEARHVRECLRKGKDMKDWGRRVAGWWGKTGREGSPRPIPQPEYISQDFLGYPSA